MKTKNIYVNEINRLLTDYLKEIDQSNLTPLSAKIYQTQSTNFVRWIMGEYKPGSSKK
ncbi:hypothetical protein [Dyadobacter sp. NIV53]|uniref:hypothetical protein n=1 Tax=Dyadobacter sp. NIV53 TaxID=2861765 RepID=UPI001C868E26|nr:hypothetical protein [Dyadobacter sp. NIV53]